MPYKYQKIREIEPGIWLLEDGQYLLDISMPGNKDERIRKKHKTQSDAKHHKAWAISQKAQNPDWKPKIRKQDNRRLNKLIDDWYEVYGKFLKDGKRRKTKLRLMSEIMGNPVARAVNKETLADYRTARVKQNIKLKTVNNEHGYLCSLFNKLIELGKWQGNNPIAGIPKFRLPETELAFLEEYQIADLFDALEQLSNRDVLLIVEVCLSTGARWSEAQKLHSRHVQKGMVHYVDTKTNKNRRVNISKELERTLKQQGSGPLFRKNRCEKVFERALQLASIELPDGQLTHVLRHTFATHYLANGGDVLELKNILGHTSIKTTEKYLHIIRSMNAKAPDLNPVTVLRKKQQATVAV